MEATDPKFDDVKILTRSEQGNLITKHIKVSINEYISPRLSSHIPSSPSDKYYQETGYLKKYATIRRELGGCVRGLGPHLSKEVAFTF